MFEFTIKPDDGDEFVVEATSRDIVRWESGAKGRSVGSLTDNMKMTDLTDLAWYAADRRGLYAGDIREFRAGVDIDFSELGSDDEPDEAGPTRAAR